MERNPFLVTLDNDNDEAGVRTRLSSHHGYQESYKPLVREWLREQEETRANASASKRDAREEETLAIAKSAAAAATAAALEAESANTIARSNSRRIWRSEMIAAVAAIAAIVAAYAAIKGIK